MYITNIFFVTYHKKVKNQVLNFFEFSQLSSDDGESQKHSVSNVVFLNRRIKSYINVLHHESYLPPPKAGQSKSSYNQQMAIQAKLKDLNAATKDVRCPAKSILPMETLGLGLQQGNLLRGINNKTVKRKRISIYLPYFCEQFLPLNSFLS